MNTDPSDPGRGAISAGHVPPVGPSAPANDRFPPAGLWLAVVLAVLAWALFRSLGLVVLALAAWLLAQAMPGRRDRRAVQGLLLLFAAVWIVHAARWVVYPLIAGFLAAQLLAPLVAWLEARRVRRPLAVVLTLIPGGLLVALTVALLVPAISRQVQLLILKLPQIYAFAVEHAGPIMHFLGKDTTATSVPVPALADSLGAAVSGAGGVPAGTEAVPGAAGPGSDLARQLFAHIETLLRAAFGKLSSVGKGIGRIGLYLSLFFLTPVVAYHLMVDRDWFRDSILRWLPVRWQGHARRLAADIGTSLQRYLRGQLLVAGAEAVLFSIVFAIAGLPQPVALGLIAGILSLVPILGFWLTVTLVILNALTGPATGATLLKAGIGIALINLFEGQVLVPKIQGSGMQLHPLVVLLGVLLFGAVFGFVGLLLAVPAMSVIRGVLPDLEAAWLRSATYRGSDDQIVSPEPEEGTGGTPVR